MFTLFKARPKLPPPTPPMTIIQSPTFLTEPQIVTFLVWGVLAVILINRGGRNNGIFSIVVQTGIHLIILGALAAGMIGATGTDANKWITDAAVQLVLVLSAGVGGSYVAHANMSLRDYPNRLDRPEGPGAKIVNDAHKPNNIKRREKHKTKNR